MTIVEFLEARLAEDEAAASAGWPERWQVEGNNVQSAETGLRGGWEGLHTGVAHLSMTVGKYQMEVANAEHIARHDPGRVLREVAAKRAILRHCIDDGASDWEEVGPVADSILEALARVYSDHPDFDPAWAVEAAVVQS